MSKGPGRIERAIAAVFADQESCTAQELLDGIFGNDSKAARVSLYRAATKVCARTGWIRWWERGEGITFRSPRYHAQRCREELHRQVEFLRGEDPKDRWFGHRLSILRASELGESLETYLTKLQHEHESTRPNKRTISKHLKAIDKLIDEQALPVAA